jgi:hypothetical protein
MYFLQTVVFWHTKFQNQDSNFNIMIGRHQKMDEKKSKFTDFVDYKPCLQSVSLFTALLFLLN